MSRLRHNVAANLLANGWTAAMALAFVPIYIHFMGIEAYGLIGFFIVLQGVFSLLDLGLSATLSREMARLSVLPDKAQEMRDLVRTLEIIYWAIALFIGLIVIALAPIITHRWVQAGQLPNATVKQAIMLMGLAMALQWPFGFYSGGLMGLQRQVLLSGVNAVTATGRGAGAVLILWLISPTIQAFFVWQIISSGLRALLVAALLWRGLPATGVVAGFKVNLLRNIGRFAAGMTGISAMALILTQLDKIILSKMLTLEMFGYYSLATMAASVVGFMVNPFFAAIYPRLTQLVTLGNQNELKEVYHRGCQVLSVLIFPMALLIALFSRELLFLWTRNQVTVANASLILSFLVIGAALNSLIYLPYALQLANGWTRLTFYMIGISAVFLVPLIILMTLHYGAVGAAIAWIVLNTGYAFVYIPFMHRRLLIGEKWRWYLEDVGLPLVAALAIIGVGRWLINFQMSVPVMGVLLFLTYLAATVAAALAAPRTRTWIIGMAERLRVCMAL
jgi:O-antigen/teichoic acid export membrane protein